jgi:hypothetical protein
VAVVGTGDSALADRQYVVEADCQIVTDLWVWPGNSLTVGAQSCDRSVYNTLSHRDLIHRNKDSA